MADDSPEELAFAYPERMCDGIPQRVLPPLRLFRDGLDVLTLEATDARTGLRRGYAVHLIEWGDVTLAEALHAECDRLRAEVGRLKARKCVHDLAREWAESALTPLF